MTGHSSSDTAIRTAEPGDRDRIWPLARAFASSFAVDRGGFDATFASLLNDSSALLLAAETGHRIVGYLLAFRHATFFANGAVVWIEELMVAEDARRGGVGRALVMRAEQWGASNEVAYLALASRRAVNFYLGLGYEESAVFLRKLLPRPTPISGGRRPGQHR